ncbi:MAG: nucleotidyltransferase domain-containing protein [Candidatus Wildermuthbacteria bacterium]|nr:nucleotidyltransferase domain-containing protein [Candidatus Wildermuthbacteria bacterium]
MQEKSIENLKENIAKVLEEEEEVLFAYIFGSFVRGDAIGSSDIDIAVFLSPESHATFFEKRLELMEKLTRGLRRDADVIILNTSSPFLRYAVLKEGILTVNQDSKARLEFELRTMNEYFDYKPILKLYRERLGVDA